MFRRRSACVLLHASLLGWGCVCAGFLGCEVGCGRGCAQTALCVPLARRMCGAAVPCAYHVAVSSVPAWGTGVMIVIEPVRQE